MAAVIKIENLSKAYQLGQFGTKTISGDVQRWWITKILGKEDPFLKIGETNDRTVKGESNMVWSLMDINFEVQQGEALGIIGKNGAGKSTLLKILSRVTAPTTGKVRMKGRVASLLEVGTGFHPELSGRENIFLNGAILGMRKWEIQKRLDEIVDFAGVERYLDTPVKRYSSGMYVRLAFAVAAHLDAEILVVDEVLAVGDAEFQKKCLGKMGDISKGEGRTILFVSHNLASIERLCPRSILLNKGIIENSGNSTAVIGHYFNHTKSEDGNLTGIFDREGSKKLTFTRINLFRDNTDCGQIAFPLEPLEFKVQLQKITDEKILNWRIDIGINDIYDKRIAWFSSSLKEEELDLFDRNEFVFRVKSLSLAPGDYRVNLYCEVNNEAADYITGAFSFKVTYNNLWPGSENLRENFMATLMTYEIQNYDNSQN